MHWLGILNKLKTMNKIALVTGSTKGIGLATAKRLEHSGVKVIYNSNESSNQSSFIKADISSKQQVIDMFEQVHKEFGRLDYLVANAGIMPLPCGISDITDENIQKTIDVNLKGTFWTLKYGGELIQKTSEQGAIVALTSVDGLIGEPYGVIYFTTKAGIISLTKSFARKLSDPLVRVNAVAPGLIDTPLTASTGEDPSWTTDFSIIKRIGKADEVANAVNFLLSGEATFITGQILAVDGGFTLK